MLYVSFKCRQIEQVGDQVGHSLRGQLNPLEYILSALLWAGLQLSDMCIRGNAPYSGV
jgi:hypothetical protein